MKTLRFASMLFMAVTLAFCVSSCSSDDDEEEPLPGGGQGQVDDGDEPSGGGTAVTESSIVGFWVYRSESEGVEESLRFTPDGSIKYSFVKEDARGEVSISLDGSYFITDGKVGIGYYPGTVYTSYGSDSYGGFADGVARTVVYDAEMFNGIGGAKLYLDGGQDGRMELEKYEADADWSSLLAGYYTVMNENTDITESIRFTSDSKVEYRQSGRSGSMYFEISADGTYTVSTDMVITVRYSDVSAWNSEDYSPFNGFADGEPTVKTYYMVGLFDFLDGDEYFTIYNTDGKDMVLRRSGSDVPDVDGSSLVGTWLYGHVTVNDKPAVVQIVFQADGTGRVEAWYDEGGFDIYPFEYDYFEDKDENRWYVEFVWMGMYGLMFEDGVDYEVNVTTGRLVIGGYTFERQ